MPSDHLASVPGIEPVEGWTLRRYDYPVGRNTVEPCYFAVRDGDEQLLNTSSYFFTPTQEHFAWFVRHGFPHGVLGARGMGPLCDATIDAAIAAERAGKQYDRIRHRVQRTERVLQTASAALVAVVGLAGIELIASAAGVGL